MRRLELEPMHMLHEILVHVLDVLIRMHMLDVLLLLLATAVTAPLFLEFQPQSNNAAGSVAVSKTTVLSLPTVLKHKCAYGEGYLITPSC